MYRLELTLNVYDRAQHYKQGEALYHPKRAQCRVDTPPYQNELVGLGF